MQISIYMSFVKFG